MEDFTKSETVFRDYVRIIFRYKLLIILCSFMLLPYVYYKQEMVTPFYTASVKMVVSGVKEAESDHYRTLPTMGQFVASTLMELVKSKIVIERVVEAMKLYDRPIDFYEMQNASKLRKNLLRKDLKELELELAGMTQEQRKDVLFRRAAGSLGSSISVNIIENTFIFVITVRDFNPSDVIKIANSVSRSYIIFDLEQQVEELKLKYGERHSGVVQLEKYIEDMYKTLDGKPLPDIEAMGPASVKVIGQALSSGYSGTISKKTGLVLAFLIGLFGGTALAFILDYSSQTIKSFSDVEKYLNIPFLGSIPKGKTTDKWIINNSNPGNKYTRYYQNISNHLDLSIKNKGIRSILISDLEGSEDTVNVVANIGYYLTYIAKSCRVLIIDTNWRHPLMSRVFNIVDTPGLVDIIEGKMTFEDVVKDVGFNLYILNSGQSPDSAVALMDSPVMPDIIKKAKEHFDLVLVYSADLKNFTDAVRISSYTDAFVLVINEGKVRRFLARKTISQLEQKKIRILGAILNNRRMVIPEMVYKRI